MVFGVVVLPAENRLLLGLAVHAQQLRGVHVLFGMPALDGDPNILLEDALLNEVDVLEVITHVEDHTALDAFDRFERGTDSELGILVDVLEFRDFLHEVVPLIRLSLYLLLDYFLNVVSLQ